jgi:hypothetical protein
VRAWRDGLRTLDDRPVTHLSPLGLQLAIDVALDALHDDALDDVAAMTGVAFERATVVAAGTVLTAAIEWCAVLLGRGSHVTLKHPSAAPGLAPWLAENAARVGLPLIATPARAAVSTADLVVAMGSDESISAIRAEVPPHAIYLPHGHRFSAAWVTSDTPEMWHAIALDCALHDGRGCLSPVVVLTTVPLDRALDGLAAGLEAASEVVPRGAVDDVEHAAIRSRRALARAVGSGREGDEWSAHGLPASHLTPTALPRSIAVVSVPTAGEAVAVLAPWRRHLSTVGTDDRAAGQLFLEAGASRVCRPGAMQRPPLRRAHDGIDWLAATVRAVSIELD